MDSPKSQSNVSLRLAEIQKRCSELMEQPDDQLELTLAEPDADTQDEDRYTLQRQDKR